MCTPWILLLISAVSALEPESSTEPNTNITTLYPVSNKTIIRNETELRTKETGSKNNVNPQTWKIESGFAVSNITDTENKTINTLGEEKKELQKEFKPSQHLGSFFDEDSAEVIKNPAFGPIENNHAIGFVSSAEADYHNHINHASFNKIPKEIYSTHKEFPYKFEDTVYTRTKGGWQEVMDSKPTVEAPVKVPAGGFYTSPDTFKERPYSGEDIGVQFYEEGIEHGIKKPDTFEERPHSGAHEGVQFYEEGMEHGIKKPDTFKGRPHSGEDVGVQFYQEGMEHGIKKRVNPWQNLLRLVTAFIPVGLIISALTPSLITIQNVNDQPQTSLPYRRSDRDGASAGAGEEVGLEAGAGLSSVAPISERCRRRLLCELHSERNYIQRSSAPRRHMKHCYKIHCEDTEALWRTLRWLFTYNQGADSHRGRHFT